MSEQDHYDDMMQVDIQGDIREDVKMLGLGLQDVAWIFGVTVVIGFIGFNLPIGFIEKIIWLVSVFLITLIWRWMEIGYRLRRFKHDIYSPDDGLGEDLDEYLGVEQDGFFYRSGNDIQMVLKVEVPPWAHEKRGRKVSRIAAFEAFQRACIIEGFEAEIMAEQVPDFQHGVWNHQRSRTYASEGIQMLSLNRVARQEMLAKEGLARRSVYTFLLRIPEFRIKARQRDNEPPGLSKQELIRHRMVAELLEKQKRVCSSLEATDHRIERVGGFVVPELISRTWANFSWVEWKAKQATWQEPEEEEPTEEESISYEDLQYEKYPDQEEEPVAINHDVEELNDDQYGELVGMAIGEPEPEKEPTPQIEKKRRSLKAYWSTILQLIQRLLQKGKEEIQAIRSKLKRKPKAPIVEEVVEIEVDEKPTSYPLAAVDEEEVIMDYIQNPQLEGVFWMTSPMSGGQSFLSANIAAARALQDDPVTLIDLSKDRGTITLINPLIDASAPTSGKFDYWVSEQIKRREQRMLRVITPVIELLSYPTIDEILQLIEEQSLKGLVLIDLPWDYPEAEKIRDRYPGTGIIDSNYHHWLQWEKEASNWQHDLWLNQVDPEMEVHFQKLIKEQFKRPASAVFPLFQLASKYAYMGRPLAVSGKYRSYFMFQQLREENHENAQDTA